MLFVLNEVFGYAHTEIAEVIDRSPAAVRQLAHCVRSMCTPVGRATRPIRASAGQATERFVEAALGGDIAALMEILAPDVTVWTDGGGKASGGLRPVHGRDKAARLFAGYATRRGSGFDLRYRRVNGDDSAVLFEGESPYAVMVMDLTADGSRCQASTSSPTPRSSRMRRDDENQETGSRKGSAHDTATDHRPVKASSGERVADWFDGRLGVYALGRCHPRRSSRHDSCLPPRPDLPVQLRRADPHLGVNPTLFFHPSMNEVTYQGGYLPLNGIRMSEAYASTLHISFDVRGGLLVRQLHHWAALVFLAAMLTHMTCTSSPACSAGPAR